MPDAAYQKASVDRHRWGPTHLCEFGADLTAATLETTNPPMVRASLEGTGSGIARLAGVGYPTRSLYGTISR